MNPSHQNPRNLYKDPVNGVIFGVCAGIADYFDLNRSVVRLVAFLGLLLFTPTAFFLYIGAAFILKKKSSTLYDSEEKASFWRKMRRSPRETSTKLRRRFLHLDRRLQQMEAYVTSPRFQIDRALKEEVGVKPRGVR